MNPEFVTLGEPLAVFLPLRPVALEKADHLEFLVGGAEANTAMALGRIGHAVAYVGRVGDDPFGRRVLTALSSTGVDVSHVHVDPEHPTGLYFREWLPDGVRRVYYYRAGSAATQLAADDVHEEMVGSARVLLVSGITPALGPSCAGAVARAVDIAKANGVTVAFDPNYRPRLWDKVAARRALLPLIASSDLLLMGHEDAFALMEADGEPAMRVAASMGVSTVVMKSSAKGASAYREGSLFRAAAAPVHEMIDPVGAGDAFNAGFLSAWLRGYDIEEALAAGNELGAAKVECVGDSTMTIDVITRHNRRFPKSGRPSEDH